MSLFRRACLLVITGSILVAGVAFPSMAAPQGDAEDFEQAAASARIASYSLSKVQRWLHEKALPMIDGATGLYRADGYWNYRDTAADCYPFFIWAAHAVDLEVLNGPARQILHAEMKLCNQLDRIPVPYDFENQEKVSQNWDEMVFGASEYVKDGLIPIIEVTGRDEWFDRMKAIEEDIWKHAPVETPFGKIPSTNIEVNGEQIQALVRLYTMTGEKKFLEWAERLADYYFNQDDFVPTWLRDHGCEIIGGLGLLLAVESEANPVKAQQYAKPVRHILDEILARGLNPDGLTINTLAKQPGRTDGPLSDGWGYNYVANLCYDMVVGGPRYRLHIEETFRNLAKPQYKNYPWEGTSIDGFADSLEGGIYLLNRLPVAEGLAWTDREMAANVVYSDEPLESAELWGTMKLQSNGVRTVIMHALMHTRGLVARPWRRDLTLGAAQSGQQLAIVMSAEQPWSGRLVFDIPRHRLYMGFKKDWPRMNALPEWYVVEPEERYTVQNLTTGESMEFTGEALHEGLPLELQPGVELRLLVQ